MEIRVTPHSGINKDGCPLLKWARTDLKNTVHVGFCPQGAKLRLGAL